MSLTRQQKVLRGAEVAALALRAYSGGPAASLPTILDLVTEVLVQHLPEEARAGMPGAILALASFMTRAASGGDPRALAAELADILKQRVVPELRRASEVTP